MSQTGDTFGLSPRTLGRIQSVFGRHPRIEKAILYGSRAKGTFKPGSDIDLTLVGAELDGGDLLKIEVELDDLFLPYQIDLSLQHQITSLDLLDHIQRKGVLFYQRPPVMET